MRASVRWVRACLVLSGVSLLAVGPTRAEPAGGPNVQDPPTVLAGDTDRSRRDPARYAAIVRRVAGMPGDARMQARAARHGLNLLNILWEDTGRWIGSSVGPNISDVTIEVEMKGKKRSTTALMPVLRHPNFSDLTGDVPLDGIMLPVGNQRADGRLSHVSLRAFLADPTRFMSLPDKGRIRRGHLLARRDSHALVSTQATFLPIPQGGEATFWPVIFNYQSTHRHPAVLTLLVTRQGTSMTVIDNARDSLPSSWGQRLFFNHAGERAPLTAERLSTVRANGVTANGEAASSLGDDANVLMIVQVPLQLPRRRMSPLAPAIAMEGLLGMGGGAAPAAGSAVKRRRSDMELAVLGHGPKLGPFTELDGLTVTRDPRFPVRVTVQFYQAIASGAPTGAEIKQLARQIRKVYDDADYVGSLVVPTAEDRERPTAWSEMTPPPAAPMCGDFAGLIERGVCGG